MDCETLRGRPSWLGVGKGDLTISLSRVGLCDESVLLVSVFECDESVALGDEDVAVLKVSEESLSLELSAVY